MSDDSKPKERTFEFPMMPIFGVDLGERLGAQEERQKQMAIDLQKLDARMDVLEAKIDTVDSRVDKCLVTIIRLDERSKAQAEGLKSVRNLVLGLWVTVGAGVILQFFLK